MKRSELLFNLLSVPLDIAMLFVAGVASFYIRLHTTELVGPVTYQLQLKDFISVEGQLIPVMILVFALLGLYNLKGTRRFIHEFNRIVIGASVGLLFVIVLFFFNHTIFPSRFIILATWGMSIILVIFGRLLLKYVQEFFFARGYGLHKLLIVNGSGLESEIIQDVLKDRTYGYKIIKELRADDTVIEELEKVYENEHIDEIMQASPGINAATNLKLVEFARNKGLQFSFVPNLFDVQRNNIELNNLKGVPVISLKNTPLDGWGRVAKRVLDIVGSLAALIILSPIFLIFFIAIKVDSPGRVIYSALRGGRQKDFRFHKFRSMYSHLSVGDEYGGQEAEKVRQELWKANDRGGSESPFLKIKHDPRVTRVGRILRKTKLDELPQFWNVLKGDMSLVGPRAHVIDEVERYRNTYRRMFSIKPGVFGVSQVAQITWPDLPFEEEIRLNTYYIENWSLWWDIKILVKSFLMLVFGKRSREDY